MDILLKQYNINRKDKTQKHSFKEKGESTELMFCGSGYRNQITYLISMLHVFYALEREIEDTCWSGINPRNI